MENSNINRRDDATVIGKRFGKLVVIKYAYSKNQQRYFECKCDCGSTTFVPKGQLKSGVRKSCGCLKAPYKSLDDVFKLNTQMNNSCLEWTGSKDPDGYGKFTFKNKPYKAHRAQWERLRGEILEGMIICHNCDNKACVKIEHLYAGTPSQNSKDMVRNNRQAQGSKNGSAKLNETQVMEIKKYSETLR